MIHSAKARLFKTPFLRHYPDATGFIVQSSGGLNNQPPNRFFCDPLEAGCLTVFASGVFPALLNVPLLTGAGALWLAGMALQMFSNPDRELVK